MPMEEESMNKQRLEEIKKVVKPTDKTNLEKICEELAAENDDLRDQLAMRDRLKQEPCDDAVKQLKKYTHGKKNTDKVEINVLALNRIIKALSQEPCDDAVSRQAYLLDWLCRLRSEINCGMDMASVSEKHRNKMTSVLTDVIKQLSSVQPKPIKCDDVVSRQAVLDEIDDTNRRGGFGCKLSYTRCRGHIEQLPSVRPQEPKTGRWISLDDFRGKYNENGFMCSKCGEHSDYEENFCPNCGAKMVEQQERNPASKRTRRFD